MNGKIERLTVRVSILAERQSEDSLFSKGTKTIDVEVCLDDNALAYTRLIQKALADTDRAFIHTQPRIGKVNAALWPIRGTRGASVPFLAVGWLSEADQRNILLPHSFGLSRALLGTQVISLALVTSRSQTNPGPILKSLLAATDPQGNGAGLQSVDIRLTGRCFDGLMLGFQLPDYSLTSYF